MSTTALDRVQTERMVLERLSPDHLPELVTLLCDPRVAAFLWPGRPPPTGEEIASLLPSRIEHWERYGFGMWLMRDRRTGEMVGRGGLQNTFVAGVSEIEVGWAVVPERWGEGLATELAVASCDAGFAGLGLVSVVAFTLPYNAASRRVMEKAGFAYESEVEHVGLPHVLYRRRAERRGARTG